MTDLPNADPESRAETLMASPDKVVKVRELFGVDSDMEVPAFSEADERVPDLDPTYVFDPDTTMAICAGFSKNRRVMRRHAQLHALPEGVGDQSDVLQVRQERALRLVIGVGNIVSHLPALAGQLAYARHAEERMGGAHPQGFDPGSALVVEIAETSLEPFLVAA